MKKGRTTVHDIARELKITASTVSRALNDHPLISDRTKKAVRRVSKKLSYQYHGIAAALRNGRSNIIGVIVPTADRHFFASIIRGIEEMANKAHYQVMICQTYEDPEREAAVIDTLLNARVDGILASLSKRTNLQHYEKIKTAEIPLVLFDRVNDQLGVSQVVIDDFIAAYKAVEHLINQGCRRIAHFTNLERINIFSERLRGYKTALQDHGLPFEPELVVESHLQLQDGRDSMQALLKLGALPDAIFSASDLGAMGALQVLKENDIRVPQQIAIIGFANEPFTMFCEPPITSINQHCTRMGNLASELFLDEIKTSDRSAFLQKKVVLMPELVIRQSSLKK